MSVYAEHLRNTIIKEVANGDKPLDGLKISVDAGNGTAGFYAYDVLEPLGANVSGSQFTEPNGMFPNHIPNPENSVAIASACEMVKKASRISVLFLTLMQTEWAVLTQAGARSTETVLWRLPLLLHLKVIPAALLLQIA